MVWDKMHVIKPVSAFVGFATYSNVIMVEIAIRTSRYSMYDSLAFEPPLMRGLGSTLNVPASLSLG